MDAIVPEMILLNNVIQSVEEFEVPGMTKIEYDIACVRKSIDYLKVMQEQSLMTAIKKIVDYQHTLDFAPGDRLNLDKIGEAFTRAAWVRRTLNCETLDETLIKLKCMGGAHDDEF